MQKKYTTIIKSVCLFVYVVCVFIAESFFREPLFNKSLEWEKEWQGQKSNPTLVFFKIITEFGTAGALIPIFLLVFIFSPINKAYTFLRTLIYASYFDNVLKIIYGNPRPFWINPELSNACDGGYGNPSGHSFSSMAVYLAVWDLVTNIKFFAERLWLKILTLFFFISLVIAIILSRIYLGVHSVNQILFGICLGFAMYYLEFNILCFQKMSGKKFFEYMRSKLGITIMAIKHGIYIIFVILCYSLIQHDNSAYIEALSKTCPDLDEYRKFNNDGFFIALTVLALIGAHYGIILLAHLTHKYYPDKEEYINRWNHGNWRKLIFRILLLIAFALPIILNVAIPGKLSLTIVFIFKVAVPYLITGFNVFGPYVYVCIHLRIANSDIWTKVCNNDDDISKNKNDDKNNVNILPSQLVVVY